MGCPGWWLYLQLTPLPQLDTCEYHGGVKSLLGTGLGAHTLWDGQSGKLTHTLLCEHIQRINLGMGTDLSDALRRFILVCVLLVGFWLKCIETVRA